MSVAVGHEMQPGDAAAREGCDGASSCFGVTCKAGRDLNAGEISGGKDNWA